MVALPRSSASLRQGHVGVSTSTVESGMELDREKSQQLAKSPDQVIYLRLQLLCGRKNLFWSAGGGSPEESFRFSRLHSLWAAEIQWHVPQWTSAEERDFEYTAISREVVGKNVHVKIPKGNTRYDQYTVPDAVAVEPSAFRQHSQTYDHGLSCHSFKFLWKTVNSKPPTIPFGIVAFTFSDNLSRNSCTCAEVHWGVIGFPLLKVSAGAKTERFLRVPPPPPNKCLRPQSLSPCPGLWASAEERDSKFITKGSIKLTQVFLKIALGFLVLHAVSS